MANILFESLGENYQVPGLPYEENYRFVRPVILDDVPSGEEIMRLLREADSETLTNPWSVQVVRGFRDYIPTTFRRVTADMPTDLFEMLFGSRIDAIPEPDRVLLQLQTEVEAKGATIDAAITHGRADLGTVVNKAHVANRLYMIGRLYDHIKEREYPMLFGDLTDKAHWPVALSQMKEVYMQYMLELPLGPRKYSHRLRKPDVGKAELEKRFGYISWLQEKLGDNLLGVLLYGSAARTDDPDKYGDFDNWVKVRDVAAAHRALAGTAPSVVGNKVVERCPHDVAGAKHLGIHLFPESEAYLERHIRFLHDSVEFRKHTRVLYGEFLFPKIAMDEVVERGISHAYIKLKTIAGSLNWAYGAPEKIQGKPNLYEFIVKNLRFFLQHGLNAIDAPKFRDKEELNVLLADRGLVIPPYKDDLSHIRDSLIYAMVGVLQMQKEIFDHRKKTTLNFMVSSAVPDGTVHVPGVEKFD